MHALPAPFTCCSHILQRIATFIGRVSSVASVHSCVVCSVYAQRCHTLLHRRVYFNNDFFSLLVLSSPKLKIDTANVDDDSDEWWHAHTRARPLHFSLLRRIWDECVRLSVAIGKCFVDRCCHLYTTMTRYKCAGCAHGHPISQFIRWKQFQRKLLNYWQALKTRTAKWFRTMKNKVFCDFLRKTTNNNNSHNSCFHSSGSSSRSSLRMLCSDDGHYPFRRFNHQLSSIYLPIQCIQPTSRTCINIIVTNVLQISFGSWCWFMLTVPVRSVSCEWNWHDVWAPIVSFKLLFN